MQTQKSEPVRSVTADTRGKHRISAQLKRLEQETRHLEEELDQLEKMEAASAACKEMWKQGRIRYFPRHMGLQIHHGINGLRVPKINQVADAGYSNSNNNNRFIGFISPKVHAMPSPLYNLNYRYREESSYPGRPCAEMSNSFSFVEKIKNRESCHHCSLWYQKIFIFFADNHVFRDQEFPSFC